ncbi:Fic family protein [Bradyrhizobium arachidis]|uniref:Fic family protein n=1 Tax=Bradyrhizobium arachidis TaxID=858423 RepID=UPI0021626E68|nr:Fic family protein [Bradyrhizobium arachidis]UVO35738.1 Fic family protein [Bradyrhizobium arachidis]
MRLGANAENFLDAAADFLAELNAVHPFREGNGRSQLAFMHLLSRHVGHPLNFDRVDAKTFMPAMIASFHGKNELLKNELRKLL